MIIQKRGGGERERGECVHVVFAINACPCLRHVSSPRIGFALNVPIENGIEMMHDTRPANWEQYYGNVERRLPTLALD